MTVCRILDGRRVAPHLSFNVNPGSRQVLENVADQGGIMMLLLAGAQIHQPGCLGCIGMGQAPGTGQVSLRTFPRNFPGRSGTKGDQVYLCSPETAAAAGLFGVITDPRELGKLMAWPGCAEPAALCCRRLQHHLSAASGRSAAASRSLPARTLSPFPILPNCPRISRSR